MSLELLKQVACPAGAKCTAFHCLFRHANGDGLSNQSPIQTNHSTAAVDPEDQDVPRKRLKVDQVTTASPPSSDTVNHGKPALKSIPQSTPKSTPKSTKLTKSTKSTKSTLKSSKSTPQLPSPHLSAPTPPRSPSALPPSSLKRNLSGLVKTEQSQSRPVPGPGPTSSSDLSSTTTYPAPSPAATVPSASPSIPADGPSKPRKIETLNPRLIRSAPTKHDVRLKLLKMLYQEFNRLNNELKKDVKQHASHHTLILSDQALIVHALDVEEEIAVGQGSIYANVIKQRILKYRRMLLDSWISERTAAPCNNDGQPSKRLATRDADNNNASNPPKIVKTGLTPKQEIRLLRRKFLTPIKDLSNHGYVPAAPSSEQVEQAKHGLALTLGWEKCDRCDGRFQVFPGRRAEDGALTSNGPCKYHFGKSYYPQRPAGSASRPPKKWRCCGEAVGTDPGCAESPFHVFKVTDPKRLAAVLQFAQTPPENSTAVPDDRAVCFDCEMAYTVHGLELIRLTATAWPTGEELLDVLVRPVGEIIDLNSRFSGVWPEDVANAKPWPSSNHLPPCRWNGTTTETATGTATPRNNSPSPSTAAAGGPQPMHIVPSPAAARDLLFLLLSPTTPLIGHGLENDLNATRIIHPTLVDTALLYPHRMGLPYRNGLKALMFQHLNKTIQADDKAELGHDSAEDAKAAGELVRLKVADEWVVMKDKGWSVGEDGELVDPADAVRVKGTTMVAEDLEG